MFKEMLTILAIIEIVLLTHLNCIYLIRGAL